MEKSDHEHLHRKQNNSTSIHDVHHYVSGKVKDAGEDIAIKDEGSHDEHHRNSDIEIRGYMNLDDVSNKYNIPAKDIKKALSIPQTESNETRIGFLKRKYNFEMNKLKDIISDHIDKKSQ